jgi:hypothetical protein
MRISNSKLVARGLGLHVARSSARCYGSDCVPRVRGRLPSARDGHLLHHSQKREHAAQCYHKGTRDSFSPSKPSFLSNLSKACFDRLVLSQQVVGCFHRLPVHLSDQSCTTFMCCPNLPLCWHLTHSATPAPAQRCRLGRARQSCPAASHRGSAPCRLTGAALAGVKEDEDKKGRQRDGRRQCTLWRAEAQLSFGSEGDKDTASCKTWPRIASQGVETNFLRRGNSFNLTLNERALTAACEYLLARYRAPDRRVLINSLRGTRHRVIIALVRSQRLPSRRLAGSPGGATAVKSATDQLTTYLELRAHARWCRPRRWPGASPEPWYWHSG